MNDNNILHFLRTYGFHGGEKQIIKVISSRLKNFDQFFLDLNNNHILKKKFEEKNLTYNSILPFNFYYLNIFLEIIIIIILYPFVTLKLFFFIKQNKIKLIFCHNFQAALILFPISLIYKKKIKFVYFHRIYKKYRKFDFISSIIYSSFDIFCCNSNSVKKSLKKYTTKKIVVINNYVEKNTIKKNPKNNKHNIIFITVSRLEKRKNVNFLIKVFNEISLKYKNTLFYIIGDGTENNKLKKYALRLKNNKIIFLGKIDNVIDKLQSSSIYLCASDLEGMSNSLLEAMSVGLPTVIVNNPNVSECHVNNITALFSQNNESDFQKKCEQLLNDSNLQSKLSLNSFNHVRKNFSFNKTLEGYIGVFNELLL